jgi:hypothetical protein
MDPYLITQIEADNHARIQQAHMYNDAMNQESEQQAHMQRARLAAQSRYQQQRSDYAEASEYPCFSPLSARPYSDPDRKVYMFQVPQSDNNNNNSINKHTPRSTELDHRDDDDDDDDDDPAVTMRVKLGRLEIDARRDRESNYRLTESARRGRDYYTRREEALLFSRRGCESPYPQSESRYAGQPSAYRPGYSRPNGGDYYRRKERERNARHDYRRSEGDRYRPDYSRSAGPTREDLRYARAPQGREAGGRSAQLDPYREFGGRRSRDY